MTADTRRAPLIHPIWESLGGGHAALAIRRGCVAAYPPDISPLAAFDPDKPPAWEDLAALRGPGGEALLLDARGEPPPGAEIIAERALLRMTGPDEPPPPLADPPGLVRLGAADGAAMVALARATEPGPMLEGTVRMGDFIGIVRDGRLVAMAGTRMRPVGWTEISGVATAAEARGEGLARAMVLLLLCQAAERGERTFLHLRAQNAAARGLYEAMGFKVTAEPVMRYVRFAGGNPAAAPSWRVD